MPMPEIHTIDPVDVQTPADHPQTTAKAGAEVQSGPPRDHRHAPDGTGRPTGPLAVTRLPDTEPWIEMVPPNPAAWKKLLEYKGTLIVFFLLVAGPGLAMLWTLLPPEYTAVGQIQIRPVVPRLVFQTDENGVIPYYDAYVNTQVDIIRGPGVLQRVLNQPEVKQTRWYLDLAAQGELPAVDDLAEDLNVQNRPRTQILEVAFTGRDPRDLVVIVNAILDQYLQVDRESREQVKDQLVRKLQEECDHLQNEIEEREQMAAALRREIRTGGTPQAIAQKKNQLTEENEILRHKRNLLDATRARLAQNDMERKDLVPAAVLERAFVPAKPSLDRRPKLTLAVLFAALLAGLGAAGLRAGTNRIIRKVEDIHYVLDRPILGQLPIFGCSRPSTSGLEGPAIEAVRMIRTCLLRRLKGRHGHTVVVTSAEAGAGKTTVAALLAKSLAQRGSKVLLVDANLRKPGVSAALGLPAGPGLVELLTANPTQEGVVKTDPSGLHVLPAGSPRDGRELELLASDAFQNCLRRWRREYDVVLLDTPPVLPVADARIISQFVDGTVLVIRENHCEQEDLIDSLNYLDACGAHFLGVIYIGTDRRGKKSSHHYKTAATRLPNPRQIVPAGSGTGTPARKRA